MGVPVQSEFKSKSHWGSQPRCNKSQNNKFNHNENNWHYFQANGSGLKIK